MKNNKLYIVVRKFNDKIGGNSRVIETFHQLNDAVYVLNALKKANSTRTYFIEQHNLGE
jgi:hypothetical protein